MKSSEEMMRDLYKRRDEYNAQVQKKRNKMIRIGAPALVLCLALLAGVIVWREEKPHKSGNEIDSHGGMAINQPPKDNVINITGEKITEEEAAAYFKENYTSIVSALSQMGVRTEGLKISEKGYSHISYAGEGGGLELHQDFRDYLAYSGDTLVAIITLMKYNGTIGNSPAFGGPWFDSYAAFLKQHAGEELLFLYYGELEVVLLPDGSAVNPMGKSVSQYFNWVKNPYEWFRQEGAEAAVYVP